MKPYRNVISETVERNDVVVQWQKKVIISKYSRRIILFSHRFKRHQVKNREKIFLNHPQIIQNIVKLFFNRDFFMV